MFLEFSWRFFLFLKIKGNGFLESVIHKVLYCVTNNTYKQIFFFKVNSRNVRKRCEISSKLTIKAIERRQFFVALNIYLMSFSDVSNFYFEQVNLCWIVIFKPRKIISIEI